MILVILDVWQMPVELGAKRAYVVSSYDGMDEIGLAGKSLLPMWRTVCDEGEIDPETLWLYTGTQRSDTGWRCSL